MIECVAAGAWGGWVEEGPGRRALLGPEAPAAAFDGAGDGFRMEDFPGRWNPRRELPREIEPIAPAAARALIRAGWWLPGSGARVSGGLVVSLDGGALSSAIEFARQLAGGSARSASPNAFLFSLPSAAASVLGLLFGLSEYQATVAQGPLSGVRAVGHAVDLLQGRRLDRVLVAALSVAEGDQARALPGAAGRTARLSAALCLEYRAASPGGDGALDLTERGEGLRVTIGAATFGRRSPASAEPAAAPGGGAHRLPGCFEHLAAAPLANLISWLEEARRAPGPVETTIHHRDPWLEERGSITLNKRNRATCLQATS